ncbi:MAG: ATP-binding cassette domain-containing protein [Spirochaetales bacterium]|nr:ATP-binding cassette domain-containing protein [Spirochaetales bacterium]
MSDLYLRNLVIADGPTQIIAETTVTIPAESCTVFLGGAGSGKSTLIKAAAGLIVPQSGEIFLGEKNISTFSSAQEQEFRRLSGFIFQDSALWQDTSVFQNVAMPLLVHYSSLSTSDVKERVSKCLELVGFDDDSAKRPSDISIGKQKLVSIARGIIHEPKILFLDNPTGNLDEDSIEHIFSVFETMKEKKTTMLLSTTSSEIAFKLADYLGLLKNGNLIAFGPFEEVVARAEQSLGSSLQRLKARGQRRKKEPIPDLVEEIQNL